MMIHLEKTLRGMLVLAAFAVAVPASATVLTFEDNAGNGLNSNAFTTGYGNRVTAPAMGNFGYGAQYGWTPNIVASFTGSTGSTPQPYGGGYGNLSHVIWGSGPSSALNEVTITLTADPGFQVFLHGFDIAQWSNGTNTGTARVVVDGVTVVDDSRVYPNFNNNSHYSFDFAPALTGQVVSITFGNGWWHAVDNVAFSQVPEPASLAALGLGALALLRRRRR